MLVLLIFVILLIPVLIQFKYGVNAICGWVKLTFWQLTLLTFLGELLLSFIPFCIILFMEPLFVGTDTNHLRCGFGIAGMAIFGIPISILILFIAIIQKISIKRD